MTKRQNDHTENKCNHFVLPQEDRKVWFTTVHQIGQIKSIITVNDKLKKNVFLNTQHCGTEFSFFLERVEHFVERENS